jgi:hypothetical protein
VTKPDDHRLLSDLRARRPEACADLVRGHYQTVYRFLVDLPLDQFEKEFQREATEQAGNPVFQVFFPALPRCRQAQARADVRRALLLAALDVQLGDRGALKDHPDPVLGGPFDYVALPGGFELRSKFPQGDRPLTLTVGRRGN